MSLRKKALWVILMGFLMLFMVMMIKTFSYSFEKSEKQMSELKSDVDISEIAIKRLVGGIRIPTISHEVYEKTDFRPFDEFKKYLAEVYPEVYQKMDTTVINNYGLIFRWKGKNPKLKPILFLSHYDVVPVVGYDPKAEGQVNPIIYNPDKSSFVPIDSNQTKWDYPPFSGAVANGRIYGRGTLDMKGMLFAILESADALIAEGFQPEQDIWFAFGHDEEPGGAHGAFYIANYFKEQGISFESVYDEGGIIAAPGAIGGINKPIALIGLGEKGFLTLKIKVHAIGGHASMPPKKSSLVLAAEIIERLNKNQMPARIIPPIASFLNQTGGNMNFVSRLAIANQWLLKPVLLQSLGKSPAANALIRTTTAVTMTKGSDAPNVLASVAEITVNFRILPGDSVSDVIKHVEKVCKNYDVEIETVLSREASDISPLDTKGFNKIKETVSTFFPDAIVSSYITVAGTDAYKYQIVSDHIYRFMPVYLNQYEQRTIHNENEHISIENYMKMIGYFKELMKNC